jgi:NOP5NT (NUC127) domain.
VLFQSQLFVLFEHAAGYALFKVNEFEETGVLLPQVEASVTDLSRFNSVVKLIGFSPFKTAMSALENMNSISEGGYFMCFIIVHLCVACARGLVSDQIICLVGAYI